MHRAGRRTCASSDAIGQTPDDRTRPVRTVAPCPPPTGPPPSRPWPHRPTPFFRAERTATAPALVEDCLERIERLDPQVNAFRSVRAQAARAEAAEAQRRLDAGEAAPLLGVPVVVKDNVDIAGETTCNGTAAVTRPARGQRGRAPPARRRRGDRRQDPPPRARGLGPLHRVADLRPDPQSLGPRANDRRVERRDRRRRGRRHRRRRPGLGRRRLDPHARRDLRRLRPQALARPGAARARTTTTGTAPTVLGPIARTVRDAALFLDAVADADGFVEATEAAPRPARRRLLQEHAARHQAKTPSAARRWSRPRSS